jgi:hypothetical protein
MVIGAREFRQSGVTEKSLEAYDSAVCEFRHVPDRTGYQPAPQAKIRDGRGFERRILPIEFLSIDRAWS